MAFIAVLIFWILISIKILNKYTVWVAYWEPEEPTIPHSLWQYGFEYYDGLNGQADADTSNTDFGPIMKENHLNGY